jgi:hypothetical protein
MNKVHSLLVVWQNKQNSIFYHIGTLSFYNDTYEFSYTSNSGAAKLKLEDALANGYMLHPAFPYKDKVYTSKDLFPAFDRRLPSPNRKDYKAIMADLGLNEKSTKMELLQQTRGRIASDSYSFEVPLRKEGEKVYSSFFIHGMRYRSLPEQWPFWLNNNDKLKLLQEPTNKHDPYAVKVLTQSGKHLGYVPIFYSKAIFSLLKYGEQPIVRVNYLNEKSTPHWWLKVDFECKVPQAEEVETQVLAPVMQ